MNAEERIQMLKQIPPQSNFEKKQKFKAAIVLALATAISLLFLVYAFLQKQEADQQRKFAILAQKEAEKNKEEAERMKLMARHAQLEAEKQRMAAEEALAACEKSKRK